MKVAWISYRIMAGGADLIGARCMCCIPDLTKKIQKLQIHGLAQNHPKANLSDSLMSFWYLVSWCFALFFVFFFLVLVPASWESDSNHCLKGIFFQWIFVSYLKKFISYFKTWPICCSPLLCFIWGFFLAESSRNFFILTRLTLGAFPV